jgi:DNA-binding HxlR family transcriptional regulator
MKESTDQESAYHNPSDIPQRLLYPARMFIMKRLLKRDTEFKEFKKLLNMSDGNIWSHMRALEQLNLVSLRKEVEGRKVKSVYSISANGRSVYTVFSKALLELLES